MDEIAKSTQVVDLEVDDHDLLTAALTDARFKGIDVRPDEGILVVREHGSTVVATAPPVAHSENEHGDPYVEYAIDDVVSFALLHPYWRSHAYASRLDEPGMWALVLTQGDQGWGPLAPAVEDALEDALGQADLAPDAGPDEIRVQLADLGVVVTDRAATMLHVVPAAA